MSAVEIRLDPSELSRGMTAMRVWLDQHRVEPSSFSCRDDAEGVLLSLRFKAPHQARAFAEHFGGKTGEAASTDAAASSIEVSLSPSRLVG